MVIGHLRLARGLCIWAILINYFSRLNILIERQINNWNSIYKWFKDTYMSLFGLFRIGHE